MAQAPRAQLGVPWLELHPIPHPPQWVTDVWMLTSQPLAGLASQLPKPVLQEVSTHEPEAQDSAAFARLQLCPHAPQFVFVVSGASHPLFAFPSQLPYPAEQVIVHTPPTQAAVP